MSHALQPVGDPPARPATGHDGRRDRLRVMVADDSPFTRSALTELVASDPSLELVGTAIDADAAIDLVRSARPDVLVVDVRMPGGGGPRVARAARHRHPQARVIALSAHDGPEAVKEMLRAGADTFLVKGADARQVLHAIHHVGRGQSPFVHDVMLELTRRLELERRDSETRRRRAERIRRLIREGDLSSVFQPIVDLRDGRIVAMEALARITTPPPRPPDWWFAEAGAVGLEVDLELAALRAAVEGLDRLPPEVDLTVNMSARALVSRRARRYLGPVPADRLVIELTEHTPVEEPAELEEAIERLRARGMRFAMDDVGAGFSSLGNILRVAPDFIKLDIALVRGVEHREADRATASALAEFAAHIGARVVAEGIETRAELLALRTLGIDLGQGFLLSRPAPLPEGPIRTRIHPWADA